MPFRQGFCTLKLFFLTKNTLMARSIYHLAVRQWVPEMLCLYAPETSVCWGTCWARMVPDYRSDAGFGVKRRSNITGAKINLLSQVTQGLDIRAREEFQIFRRQLEVCPPSPYCHLPSKSHFAADLTPGLQGLDPELLPMGNSHFVLPPFPLLVATAAPV